MPIHREVLVWVLIFNYQITKPGSPARVLLILRVMEWKLLNYQILRANRNILHCNENIILVIACIATKN